MVAGRKPVASLASGGKEQSGRDSVCGWNLSTGAEWYSGCRCDSIRRLEAGELNQREVWPGLKVAHGLKILLQTRDHDKFNSILLLQINHMDTSQ